HSEISKELEAAQKEAAAAAAELQSLEERFRDAREDERDLQKALAELNQGRHYRADPPQAIALRVRSEQETIRQLEQAVNSARMRVARSSDQVRDLERALS